MDSEVPTPKPVLPDRDKLDVIPEITTFIHTYQLVVQKHNERPWGGYEIVISHPRHHDVAMINGRTWGSAIPVTIALQDILIDYGRSMPPVQGFMEWLGVDVYTELQLLVL